MNPKYVCFENNSSSNFLFFTLCLISIYIFLMKIMEHVRVRNGPKIPPGPYSWPVIGNLIQFRKNAHINLGTMARTYGPIMSVRFGPKLVVVGSSPEAAREILKTRDSVLCSRHVTYTHPASSPKISQYTIGFAKECDDKWKNLRSICRAGLFSTKAIQAQVVTREKNVVNMVKYLQGREGEQVNMSDVIFEVVFNMMSTILLSMDAIGFGPDGRVEMMELARRFMKLLANRNWADIFPILHGWDIQGLHKKARKICEEFFTTWEKILKERRENRSKSALGQEDFLDTLLDNGLSDDHINHLLLELLLAGTETTSMTVIWALAELVKNKHVMSKLRDELANNIGCNKIVKESKITTLPYLQACVKETLRLHPPVPFLLPHRATQTCKVMDYIIPKDSQVMVNTLGMARDPSIWDDPSSFKPERFLDSGLDFKGNDFEYIPFGSGRRMCPGLPMAARIVPYLVACLVHSFNWFLPGYKDPSELDMDEVYFLALRKKNPLELIPMVCGEMDLDN